MKSYLYNMSVFLWLTLVAMSVMLAMPDSAFCDQRFEFDLKWGFVLAGHSALQSTDAIANSPATVESSAISADWMENFYRVRDYIRVEVDDMEDFFPFNYRIITEEGKHRKDREVQFDRVNGKAYYTDHLDGKQKEYEIPEIVYDPLSSFFKIKGLPLEVGKSHFITMFDSKKVWEVEVKVHKKEIITVPAGTFETIKIQPLMQSEGIFNSKGDIFIWISDDERRIPVKIRTEILIGNITGLLTGGEY